ncbi:uncharacterized protein TNCV_841421 [Trichonephila clavipes]|nr:uncharacterized protein TNCV_841421 [Trichonephila clavipes]
MNIVVLKNGYVTGIVSEIASTLKIFTPCHHEELESGQIQKASTLLYASNVQASTSVRLVAEALDLPRSTVQKIMRNILRYYAYKLQLVQELLPHDFETRHLFSLQFLARLEVDQE